MANSKRGKGSGLNLGVNTHNIDKLREAGLDKYKQLVDDFKSGFRGTIQDIILINGNSGGNGEDAKVYCVISTDKAHYAVRSYFVVEGNGTKRHIVRTAMYAHDSVEEALLYAILPHDFSTVIKLLDGSGGILLVPESSSD